MTPPAHPSAAAAPGLYVHVPFCRSKCYYCDFYSAPARTDAQMQAYAREAEAEIKARVAAPPPTVYLGGGTPSVLPTACLDRLLGAVDLAQAVEITIEVNPDDVTAPFCRWLRDSAVNRVSLGVQSLADAELRCVGRRHSAAQAVEAVERLRDDAGVGNLSLDLIYGLPGSTLLSWQRSLDGLLRLRPQHLSCYLLSYEPRTRLSAMLAKGLVAETPSDTAVAMYELLVSRTAAAGYAHYEISNFALPACESRHNSSYWASAPYIGVGPSAHSYDGASRRSFHTSDVGAYTSRGWQATLQHDDESEAELFDDFVITRLRTAAGLDLGECRARFGLERTRRLLADAAPSLSRGELVSLPGNNGLAIPPEHWLVSDAIMVNLMQNA